MLSRANTFFFITALLPVVSLVLVLSQIYTVDIFLYTSTTKNDTAAAMAAKLIPSNPSEVMVIREVTPNITTLSLPFKRFGRFCIGGRATLVRLPSNRLAVFSPVSLTPEVHAHLTSLNAPVSYITALDFEHHLQLSPWQAAFPDAKVLAPEGLPEKRKKMGMEDVRFDVIFTKAENERLKKQGEQQETKPRVDEDFDAAFAIEYVPAHSNKELCFLSRRDRTLIQGDLIFNLPAIEQYSRSSENPHAGLQNRFFNTLMGTAGNAMTWQKRFIWYVASSGDRPGFNRSVGRMEGWDFDRIIPCHGDVIETGAKTLFKNVFGWHLAALKQGK